MISPTTEIAVKETARRLSELLEQNASIESNERIALEKRADGTATPDAVIELDDTFFIVEYKRSGNVTSVKQGISQLIRIKAAADQTIKLLVVPYMTEAGQDQCRTAGISWLDLSGNSEIAAPGIRISVHGRENLYKPLGRPRNPFARKSSRVARVMLQGDRMEYRQSELAEITKLNKGNISRIVNSLEEDGLIDRLPDGAIELVDPELLLDSWHEAYDFSKHSIVRGHIPARSGALLMRVLSERLGQASIEHAFTGLASAWLYTKFSDFRTVTLFLPDPLGRKTMEDLGFTERDAGANTWLVVPNDEFVLWKSQVREDVPTVHPIQVYLDLKQQPERSSAAAEELKKMVLAPSIIE